MNVWTLRNKLKTAMGTQGQMVSAPVVESCLIESVEIETAPIQEPAIEVNNRIGLNDLFEMNDRDIRALSPASTFTRLKVLNLADHRADAC